MSNYAYIARNNVTGQNTKGSIEADNEQAAAKLLLAQNLIPMQIKEEAAKSSVNRFKNRIKTKEKVIFSRQLATLLNAGLPLMQSLSTVEEQTAGAPMKAVLSHIINDVQAGSTLSDAMAKQPAVFDNIYISLVAAGEESGTLATALERLALQQEKDSETMSKIRGAMVYPLIILLVLGGVMVFMMTSLLPQVESLYSSLPGAKLPFITQVLLNLSNALVKFWWIALLGLILAGYLFRKWSKSAGGVKTLDHVKMHFPLIGPIFMKMYMARFARTGATLAASGVPMIDMLETTASSIGNVHVQASLKRATDQVKGGKALSDSLKGDPNFLRLVPDMIHIGEQSGELDTMLAKVADYFEKEVETQIKSINTVIEPLMMVIVGGIALIIVAAVLLPIYGLAGKNLGGS